MPDTLRVFSLISQLLLVVGHLTWTEESRSQHTDAVYDIHYSQDRKFWSVVKGTREYGQKAKLAGWAWEQGSQDQVFKKPNIRALAFSESPWRLHVCDERGVITAVEPGSWEEKSSTQISMEHLYDDADEFVVEDAAPPRITFAEFSPNARYFAYVLNGYVLNVWNVNSGQLVFSTRNRNLWYSTYYPVRFVSVSPLTLCCIADRAPDGNVFRSAVGLRLVTPHGENLFTDIVEAGEFELLFMTMAATKTKIAAMYLMPKEPNDFDVEISTWDTNGLAKRKARRILKPSETTDKDHNVGLFRNVDVNEDGEMFAITLKGRQVQVNRNDTCEMLFQAEVPEGESFCVRFGPRVEGANTLLVGTKEGHVYSWRLGTEQMERLF